MDKLLAEEIYALMALGRRFEYAAKEHNMQEKIFGFLHLDIGQEALSVAAMKAFEKGGVFSAYREHVMAIARGISPSAVMAELFGKVTGVSRGKGGSIEKQAKKAEPYMPTMEVDGMDAVAVYEAVQKAQHYIEEGHGPIFVEAMTCRYEGHSVSDANSYRSAQEMQHSIDAQSTPNNAYEQISTPIESHPPSSIPHPQSGSSGTASPKARALAARYGMDIQTLQAQGKLPSPVHEEEIRRLHQQRYFTPKALKLMERYALEPSLFAADHKHTEQEIADYIATHDIPLPKPLSPMRRAIISTVEASARKPVYHLYDKITLEHIKKYETAEITITVLLLKLFAEAMMAHEPMRTTLSAQGMQVWPNASISLAMAQGDALYMPVMHALNSQDLSQIAASLGKMKETVRQGRIPPQMLKGSTFGLSNLGMTGIERFDAMINADDAGIAAIGSPDAQGFVTVTLTLDHRIVNGYDAALFMQTLKGLAEDTKWLEAGFAH